MRKELEQAFNHIQRVCETKVELTKVEHVMLERDLLMIKSELDIEPTIEESGKESDNG